MSVVDDILQKGAKVAGSTAKLAGDLMEKGKNKANQISLENDLAKAQRQLGAFVYTCKKNGVEDEEQLAKYCAKITEIEEQLNFYKSEGMSDEVTAICPECGAEVRDNALFCMRCGTKLREE